MNGEKTINKYVRLNNNLLSLLKYNLLTIYDILRDTEMRKYHLVKNKAINEIKCKLNISNFKDNKLKDKILNNATTCRIIDNAISNSNAVSTAINWYVNYCPFFSTPLGIIKYSDEWRQQGNSVVNHTYRTIRSLIILTFRSHLGMNIDLDVKENDENPLDYDFLFNSTGKSKRINVTVSENALKSLLFVTTSPLKNYNGNSLIMYGEFKDAVLYAIEFISYFVRNPEWFIRTNYKSILKLHGNKWQPKMIKAIHEILESSGYKPYNLIDTCGGALGLSMNITATDYYINDYDSNKITLYKTLLNHHFELIDCMYDKYLLNQYNQHNFDQANIIVNENPGNVSNIELSAAMLFLYFMRDGRTMKSFKYNTNKDKDSTFQISKYFSNHHRMLQNACIYNEDILEFLKSNIITDVLKNKRKKSLLVVDPPYYNTTGYAVNNKKNKNKKNKKEKTETLSLEVHEQIIDFLVGGNTKFLYFYRDDITINRLLIDYGKKHSCKLVYNDILIRKEYTTTNDTHREVIIERIVTNLNVKGFKSINELSNSLSEK